jgi:hypothetical protein
MSVSLGRIGLGFVALGAAIAALVPVFLLVYPAAGVGQADASNPHVILPVVARNPALVLAPGILELLGHAIGAAAMVGLWLRWGSRSYLVTVATLAGVAWMAVDVVDNALTLQLMPALASAFVAGDASAGDRFSLASSLIDALRLAGHFAGGLWVVGVSMAALGTRAVNPAVAWLGVPIGAVLAANPIVPALLNVSFMTLPIWIIAFGVAVARSRVGAADRLPQGAPAMA